MPTLVDRQGPLTSANTDNDLAAPSSHRVGLTFVHLRVLMITWPSAFPVRNAITTAAACEPTASTMDTPSDHLYGRRNPSRRTNVRRYAARAAPSCTHSSVTRRFPSPAPLSGRTIATCDRRFGTRAAAMSPPHTPCSATGRSDLVFVHGFFGNLWGKPDDILDSVADFVP